jgi:hypothetical protein
MNLLSVFTLAFLLGFKCVASQEIVQPLAFESVYNGIGVQVFITGLTPSTSYIIAFQGDVSGAFTTASSVVVTLPASVTTAFVILPIPYNAPNVPSIIALQDYTGATLLGKSVIALPLTLTLSPQISTIGNNYQAMQGTPISYIINNYDNPVTEGCFGISFSNATQIPTSVCHEVVFSQNASAYIGSLPAYFVNATLTAYIALSFTSGSSAYAITLVNTYIQPAIQNSRIPPSLLPKSLS